MAAVLDFHKSTGTAILTEQEKELLKYFRQVSFNEREIYWGYVRMRVDEEYCNYIHTWMQQKEKPLSDANAKRQELKILANNTNSKSL